MRSYLFCERAGLYDRFDVTPDRLLHLLRRVAAGTDTRDLVASVYLVARGRHWGGQALAGRWSTPDDFFSPRWPPRRRPAFARPAGLPDRFKQVRLYFGGDLPAYPSTQASRYRFLWRFPSFAEHAAYLFAHELHHFRRYHLGLHPGEGEVSAERWAFRRLRSLGYRIECRGRQARGRRRRWPLSPEARLAHERLRAVREGTPLVVDDPACRLFGRGETVLTLRPPRRGAWRMAVRTADGRSFLVPLTSLRLEPGPGGPALRCEPR